MTSLVAERRAPKVAIGRLWVDVNFIRRHCVLYRIHARPEPTKASSHGDKNKTPKPAPDGAHVIPPCPIQFWGEGPVGSKAARGLLWGDARTMLVKLCASRSRWTRAHPPALATFRSLATIKLELFREISAGDRAIPGNDWACWAVGRRPRRVIEEAVIPWGRQELTCRRHLIVRAAVIDRN
jgi:hypothetical protein